MKLFFSINWLLSQRFTTTVSKLVNYRYPLATSVLSHGYRQQQHRVPADITPAHSLETLASNSRYHISLNMPPAWLHPFHTNIRCFWRPYTVTMQIHISYWPGLAGSSEKNQGRIRRADPEVCTKEGVELRSSLERERRWLFNVRVC